MLEAQEVDRVTVTHLDRCLTCRSCETTCPSGVVYSELLEIGRNYIAANYRRSLLDRLKRNWLIRTVPHVEVISVRPLRGRFNGCTYRVSKSYIGDEMAVAKGGS